MRRNVIETVMGAVVVLVAISFVAFAFKSSGLSTGSGYEVSAEFNNVTGIARGTDVRISGVKVGTVIGQELDSTTYQALVKLSINDGVELPTDSSARIVPEGLLGGNYVALEPGAEDDLIKPGGRIQYTQGSVNLLDLALKFFVSPSSESGSP
ncbi:MAG: outer membrane lipid asymmetry maintenance protein MlaD [Pseudomonadota bacterium]